LLPHGRLAVGAQAEQHARFTARPAGQAHRAAVTDQREVQIVPDVSRHSRRKQPVCLLRGRARRYPAEPGDDAVHVGVNGERGPSHREREHARGRLHAHARQRRQVALGRLIVEVMQAAEVNAALTFVDGIENLLDAVGFLAGEAAAADRVLNLPGRRVRRLLPGGEPRPEPGERPAGIHVGGVLGQNRAHDLVEDGHRLLGFELTLLCAQATLHFADDLTGCRHCAPSHVAGACRFAASSRNLLTARGSDDAAATDAPAPSR
jgi:hypothetical protein